MNKSVGAFANGSQLPLALVLFLAVRFLRVARALLGELRTVSRLLFGRARKKKNRINLFVVVGVIRLIIVAVIIANPIIIIIIRIRQFRPMLFSFLLVLFAFWGGPV